MLFLILQVNYIEYADEIASEIGCRPNLVKLFFTDPVLAIRCFFGPCAPYQYRIMGPNAWDGAKKALESIAENIIFPTKTRIVHHESNSEAMMMLLIFTIFVVFVAYLLWFLQWLTLVGTLLYGTANITVFEEV